MSANDCHQEQLSIPLHHFSFRNWSMRGILLKLRYAAFVLKAFRMPVLCWWSKQWEPIMSMGKSMQCAMFPARWSLQMARAPSSVAFWTRSWSGARLHRARYMYMSAVDR